MVIYFLLAILILVFLLVLYLDKDFFSPSAMICESYILAVLCAIYNVDYWKIDLSYKTMYVILCGVLSFVVTSFFIMHTKIKTSQDNNKLKNENYNDKFNKLIFNILVFIQIITAFLYLYYVSRAVGGLKNFLNFEEMMSTYRESTYDDVNLLGIPSYVKQLVNISKVMASLSAFNIIIILLKRKKSKKNKESNEKDKIYISYIISIAAYIITCLFSAGRYGMIIYFLSLILMWNLLSNMIFNNIKNIKISKVLKISLIIAILMISFSKLRYYVGRKNDADFMNYITTYFGGSIENFDLYLKNSTSTSNVFGQRTFATIHRYLYQLGIENYYQPHSEFMRSVNGISTGNVYTGFRNYYADFRMIGVIILSALQAIIWTSIYKKIKKESSYNKINLRLILYCIFASGLFLHSYGDYFYGQVVSVGTILVIIYGFFIRKICIIEKSND